MDTKLVSLYKIEFNGKRVCIKVSKLQEEDQVMKHEILILSHKVKHKNIISFLGHDQLKKSYMMELADIDLYDLVKENVTIDLESLFKSLRDALKYLHEEVLIIHGDIKIENIVYFKKGNVFKLIDFGTSGTEDRLCCLRAQYPEIFFNMGTPEYWSPEESCERNQVHRSYPSDMWKLGLVCYEVLSGHIIRKGFSFHLCRKDEIKSEYLPMLFGLLEYSWIGRWTISNFSDYLNGLFGT